jgi:predicted XRE-type DNA-binding protein
MAGHRKFSELRAQMTPERRERNRVAAEKMLAAMPLTDMRTARQMTQVRLAELLEATQPEVSRIEKRTDMYVSTLRSYIEALGGALDIVARFPEGDVRVDLFGNVAPEDESTERPVAPILRGAAGVGR